ncbi:MAG: xanthine dehydrogenase family protein molybdopterin-binding subunit, partial [Gammaproteobacteria bacterium]
MAEAHDYKAIGTTPVRPDGVDKVTGRAQYGADLNLPGQIYGKVLRSPHAHARILGIDTAAALAIPGVFAVITGADFPESESGEIGGEGGGDVSDLARNIMARDKVLYHGHAVAAVAAKSLSVAEAALDAIVVRYDVLQPVLDLEAAMAPDAPLLDPNCFTKNLPEKPTTPSNIAAVMKLGRGNVEQGFAEADIIVEGEYRIPMAHQGYIEPHACVASCNEQGQASVWCCTQGHFEFRAMTAKVLRMNIADLKFIASEIGGGFGGKTVIYLEPLAVLLSRKARRPVKMSMTREEVFRATGPTSGTLARIKVGARRDGTLTAATAWLAYEAGAYAGAPMGPGAMTVFAPYILPNFSVEALDVLLNKPKVAAYRAPGAPQSMYA